MCIPLFELLTTSVVRIRFVSYEYVYIECVLTFMTAVWTIPNILLNFWINSRNCLISIRFFELLNAHSQNLLIYKFTNSIQRICNIAKGNCLNWLVKILDFKNLPKNRPLSLISFVLIWKYLSSFLQWLLFVGVKLSDNNFVNDCHHLY